MITTGRITVYVTFALPLLFRRDQDVLVPSVHQTLVVSDLLLFLLSFRRQI